ncbi:MAG: hypothetical protein ACQETL_03740 [Bacteroidota bacterium]
MTFKERYFDLCYNHRIHEYSKIDVYSNLKPGEAKLKYNSIDEFYMEELNISKEKLIKVKSHFKVFNRLHAKYFNKSRGELFSNSEEFMKWYKEQGEKCNYCEVSQKDLFRIVDKRNGNLTLNQKTKRSKGTLEIEKLDPSEGYTYENSVLACPFCNNAKSNLISETDWKEFFVPAMKKYLNQILN